MRETSSTPRPMGSQDYPWYDSLWLSAYERGRHILRTIAPSRLLEFESALEIFQTPADFQTRSFEQVFDQATLDEIRRVAAALAPEQLEMHEVRAFRRFVVHDHPFFCALHERLVDWVSEAAGEPVESSYNFLSLYGPMGVCPLHLDAPLAKWTLDLCIDQSAPWPIYLGPVARWPAPRAYASDWESEVKREVGSGFTSHALLPGQAILFSGSSQWHYREPMPGTGARKFCDLLFFHFMPRGKSELAEPANWARLFGIPELAYEAGFILPKR